jgi:hypothetical protein
MFLEISIDVIGVLGGKEDVFPNGEGLKVIGTIHVTLMGKREGIDCLTGSNDITFKCKEIQILNFLTQLVLF